jgi:hypothetical protein
MIDPWFQPTPAQSCRCKRPLPDEDGLCAFCGRLADAEFEFERFLEDEPKGKKR